MAHRRFASTHWEIDDVLREAKENGLGMTKKEAQEFLVSNEKRILRAMTAAGWEVIQESLNLMSFAGSQ